MEFISEEEKQRRRQSNEEALGTHAMEGLSADAATLKLLDRFASGELSRQELSAEIHRHVETLLASRELLAGVA